MSYYDLVGNAANPIIRMSITDKTFVINISQLMPLVIGGIITDAIITPTMSVPCQFEYFEITQINYKEEFEIQVDNGNDFYVNPVGTVPLPFFLKDLFFGISGRDYTAQQIIYAPEFIAGNIETRQYQQNGGYLPFAKWDINFLYKREVKKSFFTHLSIFTAIENANVENIAAYYLAYYSGIDAAVVSASPRNFRWTVSYQGKILSEREYYDRHRKVKGITKIR